MHTEKLSCLQHRHSHAQVRVTVRSALSHHHRWSHALSTRVCLQNGKAAYRVGTKARHCPLLVYVSLLDWDT